MKTLYASSTARSVRRQPGKLAGHYTTPEAAEKLGVDPATLKYRRDAADAKSYWDMLGIPNNSEMYKYLSDSHSIYDNHHYYEKKKFDKFVKLYIARPEVIRARKRHLRFPKGKVQILTYTVTNRDDIVMIEAHMKTLLKTDGQLQVVISTT